MLDYKKEELILSIKDLSLVYEDKHILNNINFDIHNITRPNMTQGQIISICGRSGCGKTSLFKLIAGYSKPTTGTIKIGVEQFETRLGSVGVVPQDYGLFNHRTIYNNLLLSLTSSNNLTTKEKDKVINEYAEYFNLSEHLKKYPCDLSGGQRQRVSILQQVLAGNKLILMDEPFSGLDSIMKDKVIDLIIKVSNLDEMNTIVIVSHDIESSCAISDTIIVLANDKNNPNGVTQGSTNVKVYDLIQEGLAYTDNIKSNPKFQQMVKEIKTLM